MAKAKVESQARGNNDQGHGKAMAKDHIILQDKNMKYRVSCNLNIQFGSTPSK